MASTFSRMRRKRVEGSVPCASISSSFQPPPMPRTTRPFEIWSRVATSLAVWIGSRWGMRAIAVPTFRFSVTAAAAARETNGSNMLL